jgi:hypothetical protein
MILSLMHLCAHADKKVVSEVVSKSHWRGLALIGDGWARLLRTREV